MTPPNRPTATAAAVLAAVITVTAGCTTQNQTEPTPAPTTPSSSLAARIPAGTHTPLDGDSPVPDPATPAPTINDSATATPTRTPLPPGKPGRPRGQHAADTTIDRTSSKTVALAFAARLHQHDTRLDNRPNDASKRAAAFATKNLREQLLQGAPVSNPGYNWTQLQAHHGYTTTNTQITYLGETQPDTGHTTNNQAVIVDTTGHGTNGWRSSSEQTIYALHLTRPTPTSPWAVATYHNIS